MKLDEMENVIKELQKTIVALKEATEKTKKPTKKQKEQKKKEEAIYPEKTRPYTDKVKILKEMKTADLKEWIPKERFQGNDYVFPLDIHDMVDFFNTNGLQGRKWIKYDEQIDYISVPLMEAYGLSKARKEERLIMMLGTLKGRVVKYSYDIKNASEKEERVLESKIKALNTVITKINGLL